MLTRASLLIPLVKRAQDPFPPGVRRAAQELSVPPSAVDAGLAAADPWVLNQHLQSTFGAGPFAPSTLQSIAPAPVPAAPTRQPRVDDIAGSLGANVNMPFQPAAQAPAAPTQPAPAPAPTQQSNPAIGTGVNAGGMGPVTRAAGWMPSNLSGNAMVNHGGIPGHAYNRFPSMGGRQVYRSDLGVPTGTETMHPSGANHNWFGWGGNAAEAGKNLTAANTTSNHNIANGRGGVAYGTDGSSTFFNTKGEVTGTKSIGSDGKPVFQSIYGAGDNSIGAGSSTPRYGVDFSRGSVKENGQPWKPGMPGETAPQFASRMSQNAPSLVPPSPSAAAPRPTTMSTPGGKWTPPEHRTGQNYRPLEA